jgi:hypothetical protein
LSMKRVQQSTRVVDAENIDAAGPAPRKWS